ncbi:hypothetical protein V7157_11695, partial [Neobacillus drentensis]|uniref:hypothetical protein n=1 Tax=Neobacillus drentensis TaxID=220684 RepID=UPI003000F172
FQLFFYSNGHHTTPMVTVPPLFLLQWAPYHSYGYRSTSFSTPIGTIPLLWLLFHLFFYSNWHHTTLMVTDSPLFLHPRALVTSTNYR